MPEGPELHIAARFINAAAARFKFGGVIEKSEVSTKNPTLEWTATEYKIRAESRGKELKIHLEDAKSPSSKTHLLFRFGMSGCFKLADASDLPNHAHLRFYTVGSTPAMALCFVDYRRFGRWEIEGDWGKDRGPDPMFQYSDFRENILKNLKNPAFNRPICEALLNQKFFNGIGNYLRAEILFRAGIRPFDQARAVLETMGEIKTEDGIDILELCSKVPKEVLDLDSGKEYSNGDSQKSQASFTSWLRCYYVEGMRNLEDGNKRTIWFTGEPGPMTPKIKKEKGRKGKKGSQIPQSGEEIKAVKIEVKTEIKEEVEEYKPMKPKSRIKKKKSQPVKELKTVKRKSNVKTEIQEEVKECKPTKSASYKIKNETRPVKEPKTVKRKSNVRSAHSCKVKKLSTPVNVPVIIRPRRTSADYHRS